MRRRRQKNPLLGKMIGVAVLINAILLPILATMGVFHPRHERLQMVQLITLPKVPPRPPQPKQKIAKRQTHPHVSKQEAKSSGPKYSKPNPNAPKVVATGGTTGSGSPTVDNTGTGKAGVVPIAPPVTPPVVTPPKTTAPPVVATQPVVTPPPPVPVHVPVYDAASVVKETNPVIPDDFSVDQAPPALTAVFTVKADGTATISQIESSGNPQLDGLVLDAVKQWTFKPATKDGVPVESYLRLKVEFDMS